MRRLKFRSIKSRKEELDRTAGTVGIQVPFGMTQLELEPSGGFKLRLGLLSSSLLPTPFCLIKFEVSEI